MTKKAQEVEIIQNIKDKLKEKFPSIFHLAQDEFIEFYGERIKKNEHFGQIFNGWFFVTYTLSDGKSIISLCREILDLNKEESQLLENISKFIFGYFKILKIDDKIFLVKDLLTHKTYSVTTIDLENVKAGQIFETRLVKNLKGEYFFFGGLEHSDDERLIELNLLDYSRDLTLDELVEREIIIINRMFKLSDEDSVIDYLIEVIGFNLKEAQDFISNESNKKREEIIRNKIIQFWWEDDE